MLKPQKTNWKVGKIRVRVLWATVSNNCKYGSDFEVAFMLCKLESTWYKKGVDIYLFIVWLYVVLCGGGSQCSLFFLFGKGGFGTGWKEEGLGQFYQFQIVDFFQRFIVLLRGYISKFLVVKIEAKILKRKVVNIFLTAIGLKQSKGSKHQRFTLPLKYESNCTLNLFRKMDHVFT